MPDEKLKVFGMNLPVIADLGDGYFLVGHPNGPAIATKDCLWCLTFAAGEDPTCEVVEGRQGTIPYEVRRRAVDKYVEWTWPTVKGNLDFANWNPSE